MGAVTTRYSHHLATNRASSTGEHRMGSWALTNTHEKVAVLQQAMAATLECGRASDDICDLVGDDTLMDMFSDLGRSAPGSDARPLVAAWLEQMTRWSLPEDFRKHFELGVRDRLSFIAGALENEQLPPFAKL